MANNTIAPEWRVCKRFPQYEVSRDGQVRRAACKSLVRLSVHRLGYLRASGHEYVHRLVAWEFCHGWREGLEVNHINGIKADNRAENLEWVTRAENMSRAKMVGRPGRPNLSGKALTDEDVLSIRRRYAAGGVRQIDLAAEYGVTQGTIGHITTGRVWKHLPMGQELLCAA